MTDEEVPHSAGELLRGATGLAQVAWRASWKAASWGAQASVNSTNCVARRMVYGRPDSVMIFSCTTFARA